MPPISLGRFVFMILLMALNLTGLAFAQSPSIDDAEELYWNGLYVEAVRELQKLRDQGGPATPDDLLRAHEFLGRSLVRLDREAEALQVFLDAFAIDETWMPDMTSWAGPESALFEEALQEFRLSKVSRVVVDSNPPGASIYLDGELSELLTPAEIQDFPLGPHMIRVELEGYGSEERLVEGILGEVTTITLDLQKEEGGGWKRWAIAGGGAIAAGVVYAIASGGGGGENAPDPLPEFPGPPSQN